MSFGEIVKHIFSTLDLVLGLRPLIFDAKKIFPQVAIKRSLFKRQAGEDESTTESGLFESNTETNTEAAESRTVSSGLFDTIESRLEALDAGNEEEKEEDIQEDYSAEEISIATQIVSFTQRSTRFVDFFFWGGGGYGCVCAQKDSDSFIKDCRDLSMVPKADRIVSTESYSLVPR